MVLLLRGVLLVGLALLVLAVGAPPVSAGPSWGWPLDGPPSVTRPFAPGPTPYSPGHRGADLSARPGAAVRSAGAGVVAYAGRLAGRGVVVVVHGALRTTYEPVDASVAVGEPVLRGQRIGSLAAGHRGCPVAACLHWGLRRGLDHLDPLRLVGAGPVRLLPREAGAPAARGPSGGVGLLTDTAAAGGGAVVRPAPRPGARVGAAGPGPGGGLGGPGGPVEGPGDLVTGPSGPTVRPEAGTVGPGDAAAEAGDTSAGAGRPPGAPTGPGAPAPRAPAGSAPPAAVVLAVGAAGLLARRLLRPP